jgi:hypothetical protein
MKIKRVKVEVEYNNGLTDKIWLNFEVFVAHLSEVNSASGNWSMDKIDQLRAKADWEDVYNE